LAETDLKVGHYRAELTGLLADLIFKDYLIRVEARLAVVRLIFDWVD
jgi:hypothetical protein